MTNYENISWSKENLVDFLDKSGQFDGSPWMEWFDNHYCQRCDSIKVFESDDAGKKHEIECSYCELNHKCNFFQFLNRDLTHKEIISMWLEAEEDE